MTIAFKSYSESSESYSTACFIPAPRYLVVGDLMIAHVVFNCPNVDLTATPPNDGWNVIQRIQDVTVYVSPPYNASTIPTGFVATFWKIATASDVAAHSFTFTCSSSNNNKGAIYVFSGGYADKPVSVSNGQAIIATATDIQSPSITPPVPNCMVVFLSSSFTGHMVHSDASLANFPSIDFKEEYNQSTTSVAIGISMNCAIIPTATDTGTATKMLSASGFSTLNSVGILFAIMPSTSTALIQVHKFSKEGLIRIADADLRMSNANGMTISQYTCTNSNGEGNIPFIIEGVDNYIPQIDDITFCVVSRRKVSFVAIGPNSTTIDKIGEDNGKYDYKKSVPTAVIDLPPGFIQLYGSN